MPQHAARKKFRVLALDGELSTSSKTPPHPKLATTTSNMHCTCIGATYTEATCIEATYIGAPRKTTSRRPYFLLGPTQTPSPSLSLPTPQPYPYPHLYPYSTGREQDKQKVPIYIYGKKRSERPNVGGVSTRTRNGASSRKGCMVNGSMVK